MCLRPNADAPTSLSSVLLLGPHGIGEGTDEVGQFFCMTLGHTAPVSRERNPDKP